MEVLTFIKGQNPVSTLFKVNVAASATDAVDHTCFGMLWSNIKPEL